MNMIFHTIFRTGLTLLTCFILGSCKKLVQVPSPVTSITSENVYSSDAPAIAAVTGIYSTISSEGSFSPGLLGISTVIGLSSDELTLYPGVSANPLNLYYDNDLNNNMNFDFWPPIYSIIYLCNTAIADLTNSSGLTPAVQQELLGEAEFDRAFCYFYLVNLYGDVPLVLTSNYATNADFSRTSQAQVWQQIIMDLHNAAAILSPSYLDGTLLNSTTERVRPIKWAALALLARSYLYTNNWTGADSAASAVINNTAQYSLDTLNGVFLMNSNEAIWQVQPVLAGYDVQDAYAFILPNSGPNSGQNVAYLNDSLVTTFEPGDLRRANWIDSVITGGVTYYYTYKYKNDLVNGTNTEYEIMLRLGEQYLIRAEAEAELNDLTDAANDLNSIRSRAGIDSITVSTQTALLSAIMHERRVELFTEWGHRWFDLKRTNTINGVMGGATGVCAAKGGMWTTDAEWFPVPLYDLQTDPNLVQNAGY